MAPAMKANNRIKQAMRKNEREVLAYIRRCNRDHRIQDCWFGSSLAWHNAIDRLVTRGVIRPAYKHGFFNGYKEAK